MVHGPSGTRVANCKGLSQKMCSCRWFSEYIASCVPNRMGYLSISLDHPSGDPQDCIYDSGGKKPYVHHHSHGKLVIDPLLADESKAVI